MDPTSPPPPAAAPAAAVAPDSSTPAAAAAAAASPPSTPPAAASATAAAPAPAAPAAPAAPLTAAPPGFNMDAFVSAMSSVVAEQVSVQISAAQACRPAPHPLAAAANAEKASPHDVDIEEPEWFGGTPLDNYARADVPLRDRPMHSAPPPDIDPSTATTVRSSLELCKSFHVTSTSSRYRDVQTSIRTISKLMDSPANKATAKANVQAGRLRGLLNIDVLVPEHADSEDSFWAAFEEHYRAAFEMTAEDEERALWAEIFHTHRLPKEPLYSFAMKLKQAYHHYNRLVGPRFAFTERQMLKAVFLALNIRLTGLNSLKEKLETVVHDDHGTLSQLVQLILLDTQQPKVVKEEKASTQRMFLIEKQPESEDEVEHAGYGGVSESIFQANIGESHREAGRGRDPPPATLSYYARVEARFGIQVYATGGGVNRFPNRKDFPRPVRRGNETEKKAQDRALRSAQLKLTQATCARCLREPDICSGSSIGGAPPCALKSSGDVFVPAQVIRAFHALLSYMLLSSPKDYRGAASSFYKRRGEDFGSHTNQMKETISRGKSAFSSYLYSMYGSDCFTIAIPKVSDYPLRSLVAMPDLGNPSIAGGLCWWSDYGPYLRRLGLLKFVRKASCEEEMGFGDGPQSPPLFVLLQVPLWYKAKKGPPTLVFVNIKVVDHVVGLLDGKKNLQALGLESALRPDRGDSTFKLLGSEIVVDDDGNHFFMRLCPPRPISDGQTGSSLQHDENGVLRSVTVNALSHMKACHSNPHSFDSAVFVLPKDGFPELQGPKHPLTSTNVVRNAAPTASPANRFQALQHLDNSNESSDAASSASSRTDAPCPTSCRAKSDASDDPARVSIPSSISALDHSLRVEDSDDESEVDDTTFDVLLDHPFSCQKPSSASRSYGNESVALSASLAMYYSRLPTDDASVIAVIPKLHEVFGHPSATQLLLLLSERLPKGETITLAVRKAVLAFACAFCARRARRREPPRPRVSVPSVRSPGQNLHLDVGHAISPSTGKFNFLAMTDQFSLFVMGDALDGAPSVANVLPIYLQQVVDAYPAVTFDLQTAFTASPFVSTLARLGTSARAVMTDAHWPSVSEKSVDLMRIELDAVFAEFPDLTQSSAVQVAMQRLNHRVMPAYRVSRAAIHLGRAPQMPHLRDELIAQTAPAWLPPTLSEVTAFLDATDRKRTDHVRRVANRRLATALRQRLSTAEPLELFNGDQYLIWKTGLSATSSGYIGPFICLGHHRSVVIGYGPGQAVAAHASRCLLYKQSPTRVPCTPLESPFLGRSVGDASFLKPVVLSDLAECVASENAHANGGGSALSDAHMTVAEDFAVSAGGTVGDVSTWSPYLAAAPDRTSHDVAHDTAAVEEKTIDRSWSPFMPNIAADESLTPAPEAPTWRPSPEEAAETPTWSPAMPREAAEAKTWSPAMPLVSEGAPEAPRASRAPAWSPLLGPVLRKDSIEVTEDIGVKTRSKRSRLHSEAFQDVPVPDRARSAPRRLQAAVDALWSPRMPKNEEKRPEVRESVSQWSPSLSPTLDAIVSSSDFTEDVTAPTHESIVADDAAQSRAENDAAVNDSERAWNPSFSPAKSAEKAQSERARSPSLSQAQIAEKSDHENVVAEDADTSCAENDAAVNDSERAWNPSFSPAKSAEQATRVSRRREADVGLGPSLPIRRSRRRAAAAATDAIAAQLRPVRRPRRTSRRPPNASINLETTVSADPSNTQINSEILISEEPLVTDEIAASVSEIEPSAGHSGAGVELAEQEPSVDAEEPELLLSEQADVAAVDGAPSLLDQPTPVSVAEVEPTPRQRLRAAIKRVRSPSPPPLMLPKHHRRNYQDSIRPRDDPSVMYYRPTTQGAYVCRMYLMNQARKRTRIVSYEEAIQMPEMSLAMETELKAFRDMRCVEEILLSDVSEQGNLVTTRWIFTIKTKEDNTKRYKARLVARGFEDNEIENVTRDSPTASTASQRLVLQALANRQWTPSSWDFTSAFLQGKKLDRDVFIAPPKQFCATGVVWRLKKPVYGLVSAPKAWYDKLTEVATDCGFDADVSDEGIFRLMDGDQVIGILALHVDDTIGGGTAAFYKAMDRVSRELMVGAFETGTFHYKGLLVRTVHNSQGSFTIELDGNDYLNAAIPMDLPSGSDSDSLSESNATLCRSVMGCIGYMASAFRPDLAVEASIMGRSFMHPTVFDAKKANATLAWAQRPDNRYVLVFDGHVDELTAFCDSSGPNEFGTQGGRLFAMSRDKGHRVSGWIYWESRKVKRVCRSSNTGEVLSVGEGYDTAMWLRQIWYELTGHYVPVRLVVDSMGASKNVVTTKLPLEKRLRIDMAVLRQGLRRGDYIVTWVPSRANLSDPLTKESLNSTAPRQTPCSDLKKPLLDALRTNCSNLRGVKQLTRSREDVSKY